MSRALVTTLWLLALHGFACAGPVPAAETDAQPSPAALPTLAPRSLAESNDAAASAPADTAVAVEIIKEAEAGAAPAESPRSAQRSPGRSPAAAPPAAAARGAGGGDDDPWGLRETSKAAVQWVKQALPSWLRSDDEADEARRQMKLDVDWSASPLEGGTGRDAVVPAGHATAAVDPLNTVGYGDTARPRTADPGQNLVREIIDVLRMVIEHPMTWLVLSLVVIAGVVVKKIDRRPTK